MRGNKLEKSHIHILKSETLSRESRVTESAQEIDDSSLKVSNGTPKSTFVNAYTICGRFDLQ